MQENLKRNCLLWHSKLGTDTMGKGPATGTYPRIPVRALFQELQSMIPNWILQEVHKCRNNKCIEEIDEQTSY